MLHLFNNLCDIILRAKNIQKTVPEDTVVNSDKITKSLLSTPFLLLTSNACMLEEHKNGSTR